jgi:predicted O-linked N-acetylglucosamine transferase (SPINDLY family)
LPETFWCYDALESELPVAALPALARGVVTFGCLSSPRKLHAGALSLWARVLAAVPGSRLLLYLEEYGREDALGTLAAGGIEAERVEFGGLVPRRAYLERYHRLDLAFDTFPFAGGTTTCDAAWMGVPVVTLSGPTVLQRAGVSIAMNLGLPELVAYSEDEFVERAVALATDLDGLAALRAGLRSRLETSPLGNAPRFARHLEAAYRTAWRRYCTQP